MGERETNETIETVYLVGGGGIEEDDEGVARDEDFLVEAFHRVDLAFFDIAIDRGAADREMLRHFPRMEEAFFWQVEH